MPETMLVLRCLSFRDQVVVFRQDSYGEHRLRHPELDDPVYFPPAVTKALKAPTFWVKGYKNNTICYYLELFAVNDIIRYVKVIVSNKSQTINGEKVYRIKTTFKTDRIKEQKYNKQLHYLTGSAAV